MTSANRLLQARWREPTEILAIALEPHFVAATLHDTTVHHEFVPQFAPHDARIVGICTALLAELSEGGPNGPLFAESLAMALSVHLVARYLSRPWQPPTPATGLAPHDLHRVLEYLHAHLAQPLTIAAMAREVGLSPAHFAVLFKRSTGSSPYRYVMGLRVARVQALLQGTHLPLGEVALQAGFANQSHMTHHVSRLLGITPLALRRA